jgi:hypothetical protein
MKNEKGEKDGLSEEQIDWHWNGVWHENQHRIIASNEVVQQKWTIED